MASNWKVDEIGKLPIHIGDGNYSNKYPKSSDFIDEGVPFISASDFSRNRVDSTNFRFISHEQHATLLKGQLKANDILVVTRGNGVGQVAWVDELYENCNINAQLALLRADETTVHAKFLFYLLSSKEFQRLLVSFSSGSAQPQLPIKALKLVPIRFPEYSEQVSIAKALDVLSTKIEINHQTNQTLEQMAQALFKSWFVDFDPVFDNALASGMAVDDFPEALQKKALARQTYIQEYRQIQSEKQGQQHRQLFPSEFEQTDEPSIGINGWIPKGWEKSNLKSFGKVVTGKTPPKKIENAFADKGLPFITPSDVDSDVFALTVARYLSSDGVTTVKNNVVEQGSVCVTCIGSQMGKTVIAPYKSVTNQQLNSIVLAKQSYRNYVFMNLRLRREELFNLGSSGSTMPILNKSSFEGLNTLKPTESVLNEFSKVTEKLIDKILLGSHQNEELSKVRDTLLPKLISGELQLPAESIKAEVSA
jgi:type I restriction enzyme S subunit